MSHCVIVVNHRAGGGAAQIEALKWRLRERLQAAGSRTRLVDFGSGSGRAQQRWRATLAQCLAEGAERVFVLGGDGTVLAVATALISASTPLAIIPLGTANLLARDLGIPMQPEQAVDQLSAASDAAVRCIDVGRVNGQLFLCASMIGLSTRLARTREAVRGLSLARATVRLLRKAFWLLRRYPYRRLLMQLDGKPVTLKTHALVIANNPVSRWAPPYPRRVQLDRGVLGIYGVQQGPLWELPRVALNLVQGHLAQEPRIFQHQATAVRLDARYERKLTVMNDGERMRLRTPLRYECLPAALSVVSLQSEPR